MILFCASERTLNYILDFNAPPVKSRTDSVGENSDGPIISPAESEEKATDVSIT